MIHGNATGERLTAAIDTVIAPDIERLNDMLQSPAVETFLECAFPTNPVALHKGFNYFKTADRLDVARKQSDTVALGNTLLVATEIAADVAADLQGELSDNADDDQLWKHTLTWLKRGPEKIINNALTKGANFGMDAEQMAPVYEMGFPIALTMLAFDALESINDNYDQSIQQIASDAAILRAHKRIDTKTLDVRMEVYARAMNMLGEFYRRPQNKDFVERLTTYGHGEIVSQYDLAGYTDLAQQADGTMVAVKAAYRETQAFAAGELAEMATAFGLNGIDFNAKLQIKDMRNLRGVGNVPRKQRVKILEQTPGSPFDAMGRILGETQSDDDYARKRDTFFKESHRILIARRFIDALAEGRIDFKTIQSTKDLMLSRPFANRSLPTYDSIP